MNYISMLSHVWLFATPWTSPPGSFVHGNTVVDFSGTFEWTNIKWILKHIHFFLQCTKFYIEVFIQEICIYIQMDI